MTNQVPASPRSPGLSPGTRAGLLVAAGVVLVGAALWAGSNGRWTARPEGGSTRTPELPSVSLPTLPTLPTLPSVGSQPPAHSSTWDPSIILYVLGGVLLAALLVMVASTIRNRGETVGRRRVGAGATDDIEPSAPIPDPDRPFDSREAADYVIACWDQIERLAASFGAGRRREQTPTEFLDRLLSVYRIDSRVAGELLGLYQRARFDHVRLQADSATRARICADAIGNAVAGTAAADRTVQ